MKIIIVHAAFLEPDVAEPEVTDDMIDKNQLRTDLQVDKSTNG